MDDLSVIREGARVDKDIVHIAYHLTIVDELMEDIIHHHLECCGRVTQSEEHDSWFKQPLVSSECSLPLVPFLDPHVVESPSEIKYGEELGITEAGQDIGDEGEGVGVLDHDLVQLPIVLYEASELSFFLMKNTG